MKFLPNGIWFSCTLCTLHTHTDQLTSTISTINLNIWAPNNYDLHIYLEERLIWIPKRTAYYVANHDCQFIHLNWNNMWHACCSMNLLFLKTRSILRFIRIPNLCAYIQYRAQYRYADFLLEYRKNLILNESLQSKLLIIDCGIWNVIHILSFHPNSKIGCTVTRKQRIKLPI